MVTATPPGWPCCGEEACGLLVEQARLLDQQGVVLRMVHGLELLDERLRVLRAKAAGARLLPLMAQSTA